MRVPVGGCVAPTTLGTGTLLVLGIFMRKFITGTNYCGPGGDGETYGELDEACKAHDEAYTSPYLFDYIENQRADKMFLQRIRSARPLGVRQHITKFVADRYFSLKTSLIDMKGLGQIRSADQGMIEWPKRKGNFHHRGSEKAPKPGSPPRRALVVRPQWKRVAFKLPYYKGRRFTPRRPPFAGRRFTRYRYKPLMKRYRKRRY